MGTTSDEHDGCLHEIDPETGMLPRSAGRRTQRPAELAEDALEATLADNAALLDGAMRVIVELEEVEPDWSGAHRLLSELTMGDHPGAALLAEHHRRGEQLARAVAALWEAREVARHRGDGDGVEYFDYALRELGEVRDE